MSKYLKLFGVGAAACAACCLPLVLPLLGASALAGVFALLCSAPGLLLIAGSLAATATVMFLLDRRRKARAKTCACPPTPATGA